MFVVFTLPGDDVGNLEVIAAFVLQIVLVDIDVVAVVVVMGCVLDTDGVPDDIAYVLVLVNTKLLVVSDWVLVTLEDSVEVVLEMLVVVVLLLVVVDFVDAVSEELDEEILKVGLAVLLSVAVVDGLVTAAFIDLIEV